MLIINQQSVNYLINLDPRFRMIYESFGIPPSWSRPPGFETLCRIILEQQVSLDSATATFNKLLNEIKEVTPDKIISLSSDDMRALSVSRQKAGYLNTVARMIIDGSLNLENLEKQSVDEIFNRLTEIRGIGPWTANVYLIFALQSPDIFPPGDVALIRTIKELWDLQSSDDVYAHAGLWSPHRSAASFFLWHYYLNKRGRTAPF